MDNFALLKEDSFEESLGEILQLNPVHYDSTHERQTSDYYNCPAVLKEHPLSLAATKRCQHLDKGCVLLQKQ